MGAIPHSRHSPEASNPEGRGRQGIPSPPRGGRLGWGQSPHSRHSPEASNPEGPPPHSSFLRRQESRGAAAGRGMLTAGPPSENRTPCITVETVPNSVHPEPVEGPARPHSRHSCEASNPEGPPPIRHSCEGRNPEGRRLSGEYSRPNRQAKTGRHASPKAQFTIPFALSLSKGLPAPTHHSSEASNPEGRDRARNPFPPRGGRLGWGQSPTRVIPRSQQPRGAGQGKESLPPLVGEG